MRGDWLDGSRSVPEYLVLKGLLEPAEVDRVSALGYTEEALGRTLPYGGNLKIELRRRVPIPASESRLQPIFMSRVRRNPPLEIRKMMEGKNDEEEEVGR